MSKQVTINLDDLVYQELAQAASQHNCAVETLVSEAVLEWLETQDDLALSPELEEARQEWRDKGGVEATEFFRSPDLNQSQ